jgi:hypothetical protein
MLASQTQRTLEKNRKKNGISNTRRRLIIFQRQFGK